MHLKQSLSKKIYTWSKNSIRKALKNLKSFYNWFDTKNLLHKNQTGLASNKMLMNVMGAIVVHIYAKIEIN